MPTDINSKSYQELIDEDIQELKKHMPKSLERMHIIKVLEWSVEELYKSK